MSIKLAIRQDDEAKVVRAYFSKLDDSQRIEVASIDLGLVRRCPGLFDSWKIMLRDALFHCLQETGYEVVHFEDFRPEGKN